MTILAVIVCQLIAAMVVSGVVVTAMGFGSSLRSSQAATVLLMTAPIGGSVWIVARLLRQISTTRTFFGAVLGSFAGYLLIVLEVPHRLSNAGLALDSIYFFAMAAAIPATLGYWISR